MEWGASRVIDGSRFEVMCLYDLETFFEFYSQIGRDKHWGKSERFQLELVGIV